MWLACRTISASAELLVDLSRLFVFMCQYRDGQINNVAVKFFS